ncbi:MAG: hypothetical protein Q7J27_10475 [Syntrophales bacterium]|nr:hypothetical protein [Syntrophales bacterium]
MTNLHKFERFARSVRETEAFFNKSARDLLKALVSATHDRGFGTCEYIFWISPEGQLEEAPGGHQEKTTFMMSPEEYKLSKHYGYLRGRVGRTVDNKQFIMVYNLKEEFIVSKKKIEQLQKGITSMPIPIDDDAIVVAGGEVLGTVLDVSAL